MKSPYKFQKTEKRKILFSAMTICIITIFLTSFSSQIYAAKHSQDLLNMTDRLDQMDKADLEDAVSKADKCSAERKFDCSEAQLVKARKLQHSEKDRKLVQLSEQTLLTERQQVEAETRALASRLREIELAEQRLKDEEERAKRRAIAAEEESNQGMSTGQAVALFGSLLNQSIRAQGVARAASVERANQFAQNNAELQASVQQQQQRFARERAELEANRAKLQRQQLESKVPQPAQELRKAQVIQPDQTQLPPQAPTQKTPSQPKNTQRVADQQVTSSASQTEVRSQAEHASARPPQTATPKPVDQLTNTQKIPPQQTATQPTASSASNAEARSQAAQEKFRIDLKNQAPPSLNSDSQPKKSAPVETKTIVAEGDSDMCWVRDRAIEIARLAMRNDANAECRALGSNWRYGNQTVGGYEQCFRCGKSNEFRCKVTQSMHICTSK